MHSKYVEADAAKAVDERANGVSEALALRTYTARLLGADPSLVLHGGGNTSVKAQATTVLGDTVDVLHVKGSGWDLATIEPPGHPAARMASLLRLLELESMTDEQMVNEMRLALLDASAPTPSVEALLHAALPARFIDHTHADAVLAVADQPDAARVAAEIWGDALLFIPYVMPGFGLAKACKRAWDDARAAKRSPTVMVLERHGVFTFGDTAKESYERMIGAVTSAEKYAESRRRETFRSVTTANPVTTAVRVRGALANASGEPLERGPIVAVRASERILKSSREDAEKLTQIGTATPDHVIRTKPVPMFLRDPANADAAIQAFAKAYDAYFAETCARRKLTRTKLDPWPRVILVPGVGILSAARTKKEAEIAADVYEHTIAVIEDASDVGTYSPVSRDDLFDVEYWSLEQAKIKKVADKPLARCVAVVTGAASGIGKATAELFAAQGAHVVSADRQGGGFLCDVTRKDDVRALFDHAAREYGGVDVVVSNAGNAPEGGLDTPEGEAALRASLETNLLSHLNVASAAVEQMRLAKRGGCLLFNASKSAFAPGPGFGPYAVAKSGLVALMRQYAIDLAKHGIRSNAVNADRIRTGIFGGGVLESRAAARGLSVDDYFRSNLLGREVSASDVASAFAWLAGAMTTTGAVITVDGGNPAAFPR